MSVPRTFNGSNPAQPATINISTTNIQVGDGSGIVNTYTDLDVSGTSLTLPHTPLAGYTVGVYVNGLLQRYPTDYTISGKVITFYNTLANDTVHVTYATTDVAINTVAEVLRYSATMSGTEVQLTTVPGTAFPTTVYVNGVLQVEDTHYTISDNVVTFLSTLVNDTVQIMYSA